jgi:hypothetical protein
MVRRVALGIGGCLVTVAAAGAFTFGTGAWGASGHVPTDAPSQPPNINPDKAPVTRAPAPGVQPQAPSLAAQVNTAKNAVAAHAGDPFAIICLHPDHTLAGQIFGDAPVGTPPPSSAEKAKACEATSPGSTLPPADFLAGFTPTATN